MTVLESLQQRHAYRKLRKMVLGSDVIDALTHALRIAPSCFNNQPWRAVFVTDPDVLEQLKSAYSKGNEWIHKAPMVIAVFTEKSLDCVIGDREYAFFDTGLATGFLLLRATELGLVAHPIAGYHPDAVKHILDIPAKYNLITLVVVGPHDEAAAEGDEKELTRPPRKPAKDLTWIDHYGGPTD